MNSPSILFGFPAIVIGHFEGTYVQKLPQCKGVGYSCVNVNQILCVFPDGKSFKMIYLIPHYETVNMNSLVLNWLN